MKHIKLFTESEAQISPDRVDDIKKDMSELAELLKLKIENIEALLNELNNFKSDSKKSNDQIDDSISNLQLIKRHLSDSLDKVDNVVNNMKDYNEGGSKFLY